jgi:hypothetical protein
MRGTLAKTAAAGMEAGRHVLAFPHDTRHHMSTGETGMERTAVAPPVTPPSVMDRTRVRHAATVNPARVDCWVRVRVSPPY